MFGSHIFTFVVISDSGDFPLNDGSSFYIQVYYGQYSALVITRHLIYIIVRETAIKLLPLIIRSQ